jgi:hypothetical protein
MIQQLIPLPLHLPIFVMDRWVEPGDEPSYEAISAYRDQQ